MFKRINESFDKKFKQLTESNLPTSVNINMRDLAPDTDDEDVILDAVSDYLSNVYEYCHDGFNADIDYDENGEPTSVKVYNIKWDTSESVTKHKDEIQHRPVRQSKSDKLTEAPIYDMTPQHDARKSFYGKARVDDNGNEKTLYSYNTPVAKIVDGQVKLLPRWDESQTTLRHVKEFLKQNGFAADSLAQMRKSYK